MADAITSSARSAAYASVLQRLLEPLESPAFERLWTEPTRPGEWTGRYQVTQTLAVLWAALYRQTRAPQHLDKANRFFLDVDHGYHFGALFCAETYALLRAHLTEAERQSFARLWLADIDAQLSRYVTGGAAAPAERLRSLTHVSNHALCACVYADAARALFPEQAAPHNWQEITNPVWDAWWRRREFWEQASNYEGFAECYHCAWARLRGVEAEFFRAPPLRNMFERNALIVAPTGIVAAYGDSGHDEHATAWIALFERVAAGTGDARYARLAGDIFGCLDRRDYWHCLPLDRLKTLNLYNARQIFAQYLLAMAWLAVASLWAETDAGTERPPAAGIARRTPPGHELTPAERTRSLASPLVDCQIALTGGPEDHRTHLLLSVGPRLVHDHADAGSILSLSRGDSVLLGTNGYLQRELAYHHCFYAQPASWLTYPSLEPQHMLPGAGADDCAGKVEETRFDNNESYCRISFECYHGLPISLRRELWVQPDGGVLLLDRVTAHAPGICGGWLLHGERVRRVRQGVYRIRLQRLHAMNGLESANPPSSVLTEFLSPAGAVSLARLPLPAIYNDPVYAKFPCNLYKRVWVRSYAARRCLAQRVPLPMDRELLFLLRLTPHASV